jgi:hypothetical protein
MLANNCPIAPALGEDDDDDDDCEAVCEMRTGRGKGRTWRKLAPVPLCPPQNPHDLTWDQTLAAAVESRLLTTCHKRSVSCHDCFNPVKRAPIPTGQEAGQTMEPVLTLQRREKSLAPNKN